MGTVAPKKPLFPNVPRKRLLGKRADWQPGEAFGQWPRAKLEAMDAEFCDRMQRAIRDGKEKPHGEIAEPIRRAG